MNKEDLCFPDKYYSIQFTLDISAIFRKVRIPLNTEMVNSRRLPLYINAYVAQLKLKEIQKSLRGITRFFILFHQVQATSQKIDPDYIYKSEHYTHSDQQEQEDQ